MMEESDIPAAWAAIAIGTVLAHAVEPFIALQHTVAVGADGVEIASCPLRTGPCAAHQRDNDNQDDDDGCHGSTGFWQMRSTSPNALSKGRW